MKIINTNTNTNKFKNFPSFIMLKNCFNDSSILINSYLRLLKIFFIFFKFMIFYNNNEAIAALIKLAILPANIAFMPSFARSWRLSGARAPIPPI